MKATQLLVLVHWCPVMLQGTVFKCHDDMAQLVMQSELGASRAILDAGYNLDCLLIRYQVGTSCNRCGSSAPQLLCCSPANGPGAAYTCIVLLAGKTSECLIEACHLQSG